MELTLPFIISLIVVGIVLRLWLCCHRKENTCKRIQRKVNGLDSLEKSMRQQSSKKNDE